MHKVKEMYHRIGLKEHFSPTEKRRKARQWHIAKELLCSTLTEREEKVKSEEKKEKCVWLAFYIPSFCLAEKPGQKSAEAGV